MKLISLLYNKINWANKPSTNTPINATNLGKMDKGIDDITKALTDNGASFNFGYDGTNYGYYKNGESTLTTFKTTHTETKTISTTGTTDMGVDHKYRFVNTSGLMVVPTATKNITSNGNNIDVKNYAKVNVNVSTPINPTVVLTGSSQEERVSLNIQIPSGYTKYLVYLNGGSCLTSLSGCGATKLYEVGESRVYLCTTSGTATITTNGDYIYRHIGAWCVIGI